VKKTHCRSVSLSVRSSAVPVTLTHSTNSTLLILKHCIVKLPQSNSSQYINNHFKQRLQYPTSGEYCRAHSALI